ncbi:MAG: D-alanyl-D-alanine carboxypeptidase [Clostridia bacterium]|nr:D-alanyl-D-alanine carboxypeptidase [Clostridia bacterium]
MKICSKIGVLIFTILWLVITNISYANLEENEIINIKNIQKEVTIQTANIAQDPNLNARIGLILDRKSKSILYEKNGQKQVPMASTTKIMTAIVILENADLKTVVTVEKKAAGTGGSRLGLKVNDKITIHDLLYGLMLESGNDAAVALAIEVGGSVEGFSQMMNKQAQKMGLINSHFVTPHGLDQTGHYTTAYELACMADYALNIPKFKEIVSTKNYQITINGKSRTISNTNELLGNLDGVYGVKTGFTNGANRCLVTSCKRGNLDIITVVLGADTKKIRTADSMKLIEYAYQNYEVINLQEKIQEQFEKWKQLNEKRIYINKGKTNKIELKIEDLTYQEMAVKKIEKDNIVIEINSLYYLEAPVKQNEIIGNAQIQLKGETISTLNIVAKNQIEKKEVLDYFKQFLKLVP